MNRYLLVLVLALTFGRSSFGQAKTNPREDAYYHFSKGRLLDDQGQPGQADHDNIEAHKLLTSVYLQVIGRANAQQPPSVDTINSAIHEFEEIIRIDPTERQSLLMLGRLYQIKGERDKAAGIYKQFLG